MGATIKRWVNKLSARTTPLAGRIDREAREAEENNILGYALPGSSLPGLAWLERFFPHIATAAPGERHVKLWEWIDQLRPGVKPKAKIDIWPRGGAKSSTAEFGVAKAGAGLNRRFALYICETQAQADEHVQNIAAHFEKMGVGRAVNKYGASKGWKRDELRTENGFNVSGIGLDVAKRGIRLGNYRPDLIIIDDVDGLNDTAATTRKKIHTITKSLLPAGSSDCAVLFVQNKIIPNGIAAQLSDGRGDFLLNREPVVEEPAVIGLEVKPEIQPDGTRLWRIIRGIPTWVGQSLAICEGQIAEWGLSAFLQEAQHKVDLAEGGLWDAERDIDPFRVWANDISAFNGMLRPGGGPPLPRLLKVVVSVDPSGGASGDEVGIVASGIAKIGKVQRAFVLESMTLHCSPEEWATAALDMYDAWEADELLAEVNFGGEMVESTFKAAGLERKRAIPTITMIRVSRGKLIRATPIQLLYDKGQVSHREDEGVAGGETHKYLEHQFCKWRPGMPSPGALDAAVIGLSRLFDLAEMVKEVKRPAAYSGARLSGSAGRGNVSRPGGSGGRRGGGFYGSR